MNEHPSCNVIHYVESNEIILRNMLLKPALRFLFFPLFYHHCMEYYLLNNVAKGT